MAIPCVSMMASSLLGSAWKVGGDRPPCGCPFPLLELQHISEVGAQCCLVGVWGCVLGIFREVLKQRASPASAVVQSWWGQFQGQCAFWEGAAKRAAGGQIHGGPFPSLPMAAQAGALAPTASPREEFWGKNKCKRQKSARSRAYPMQYLAFSCNWQIPGVILKAQCKPWPESRAFLTAWQAHGELGTQRVGHCDCGDGWTCKFVKSWSTWLGWAVL